MAKNQTEINRQSVSDAFDAWKNGGAGIAGLFADDIAWRIEGKSLASKAYQGKQQLMTELLIPFGARFKPSDPFRPTSIRSVNADGDTVLVVWDGRGIALDGLPYDNLAAWLMKLRDGKVFEGQVFWDCSAYDDLHARTEPARGLL